MQVKNCQQLNNVVTAEWCDATGDDGSYTADQTKNKKRNRFYKHNYEQRNNIEGAGLFAMV